MPKQFPQSIDTRSFHFEIAYTVVTDIETGKLGYKIRLGEANTQYSALWAIESGTGNCNPMVKIFNKVFDQRGCTAGNIRHGDLVMDLGLGDERLEDLFFFVIGFVTVKVKEVVYTDSMSGGNETIYGNIVLE